MKKIAGLSPLLSPQPQNGHCRSAVEIVIQAIKHQILNGSLRPGDQLPNEFDLSEYFGVSRGSLREAIKIMVATGILELRPGVGTFVAAGNQTSFRDSLFFHLILTAPGPTEIAALRRIIEVDILELILLHYDQNARARQGMEQQVNLLQQMISTNFEEDLLFEVDLQFHRYMGAACMNRIIESIYYSLIDFIQVSMRESYKNQTPLRVYSSHRAIIEAIYARDLNKATSSIDFSLEPWFQSPRE